MKTKNLILSVGFSLLIGLVVCFFLSIFANSSSGYSQYTDRYWFLVNRGYPQAWSGTNVPGREVPWPLVKAPLVKATISYKGNTQTWDKVIDLSRFMPLWLVSSFITLLFTLLFVKAVQEDSQFRIEWPTGYIITLGVILLLYFFWFPNI